MTEKIIEDNPLAQYIGYYDWEGMPCQILRDDEDPTAICARFYVQGKGMQPISVFDVLEGHRISEAEFKHRVMRLIAARQEEK